MRRRRRTRPAARDATDGPDAHTAVPAVATRHRHTVRWTAVSVAAAVGALVFALASYVGAPPAAQRIPTTGGP
jgi:hypothetical protein